MKAPISSDTKASVRKKVAGIYFILALFNVGVWLWAYMALRGHPLLFGTASLAYGFGLRHAVDADHIAAIDNVTRKLMQDGKRPVSVGFFFAMGHSAVVFLVAFGVALTASALQHRVEGWKDIGGVISTSVSALFLLLVAAMNIVILKGVWKAFCRVRRGEDCCEDDLDLLLNNRGFISRLFRPAFKMVSSAKWMFPLGFLFGLGFDTATEVTLLGLSASQAQLGFSINVILLFPALFAAGMSLVDTTDGVLMLGAYDWAFVRPIRKLYYNVVITFVSVLVAVLIGGVEALGLVAGKLELVGGFWTYIKSLNENFNNLGFAIVGVFIVSWCVSFAIYRLLGYDAMDTSSGRSS
jgi:high-affinity nickel-transport protein